MLQRTQPDKRWMAELHLRLSRKEQRSVLSRQRHQGPLLVQRPFYPEGDGCCHLYILHPPGGVVQGDHLKIRLHLESGAHGLVTTPAAGKFYRSNGQTAELYQDISLDEHAFLEWLPQETLLFNASRVRLTTRINVSSQSGFIGWEMLCLGRNAGQHPYIDGECQQSFELYRDGRPVFIERSFFSAQDKVIRAAWGLNNRAVTATLVAINCDARCLQQVQAVLPLPNDEFACSVSLKNDILICRFLGKQAETARKVLTPVWSVIREFLLHRKSCVPRIWAT